MKLRVAKKITLGRQCSGADCHRVSSIDRAFEIFAKACRRGSRMMADFPEMEHWPKLQRESCFNRLTYGDMIRCDMATIMWIAGGCSDPPPPTWISGGTVDVK